MAEEAAKPLEYIPEVILKKRKKRDELAVMRRKQLELGNHGKKKQKVAAIKRPEEFVQEFRAQELDLVRLKQRQKRPKSAIVKPKTELLFIIRIQGKNEMHPKTKKVLYNLRLTSIFSGVFARATGGVLEKLQRVEPYVTFGCPNLKNVRELIYKKGYALINKQRIPLTNNDIIEQSLGKFGIISIEDLVHEIVHVGPHFKEVLGFLGPFQLNKPEGGCLQGKKQLFKDGGDSGNREHQINDLIDKMN